MAQGMCCKDGSVASRNNAENLLVPVICWWCCNFASLTACSCWLSLSIVISNQLTFKQPSSIGCQQFNSSSTTSPTAIPARRNATQPPGPGPKRGSRFRLDCAVGFIFASTPLGTSELRCCGRSTLPRATDNLVTWYFGRLWEIDVVS